MKARNFFLQCFAIMILCHSVFAQQSETVRLTGRILDMMGSVVPNTSVLAYSPTKTKYESYTDENGIYNLNLPEGIYNLEINNQVGRHSGFLSVKLNNYRIVPAYDGKLNFDIVLPISGDPVCILDISDYSEESKSAKKKVRKIQKGKINKQ